MKIAIFVLAFVSASFAAPSSRTAFHEHLDDFTELIIEEKGIEYAHIMEHYQEFEEFNIAIDYFRSEDFKNLVYGLEASPEFQALVDFLENDNIDINYIIDRFNEMLEERDAIATRSARHELAGTDFAAFIADCMALLPLDRLRALYEQKREEFEDFRVAVDNLQSEEFHNIVGPFWESEVFQNTLQTLNDNHIDTDAIMQVWENTMNG